MTEAVRANKDTSGPKDVDNTPLIVVNDEEFHLYCSMSYLITNPNTYMDFSYIIRLTFILLPLPILI